MSKMLKSPKLPFRCQKRKQYTPRVLAYYGLQKPPYKLDALEPYMSQRTLEVHRGEHHCGYLEGLNKQLAKSDKLYGYTLDELVKAMYDNGNPLPEFNNAAQNDKGEYVNAFMNHLVSWNAALGRLARAQIFVNLGEPNIHVA